MVEHGAGDSSAQRAGGQGLGAVGGGGDPLRQGRERKEGVAALPLRLARGVAASALAVGPRAVVEGRGEGAGKGAARHRAQRSGI